MLAATQMIYPKPISLCVLAVALAALLSGCVMRRTVTSNGKTVEDKYVVKRPLKSALDN